MNRVFNTDLEDLKSNIKDARNLLDTTASVSDLGKIRSIVNAACIILDNSMQDINDYLKEWNFDFDSLADLIPEGKHKIVTSHVVQSTTEPKTTI